LILVEREEGIKRVAWQPLKWLSGTAGVPPATRRRRGGFQAATFPFIFALRAHCGRDARGPSQSL